MPAPESTPSDLRPRRERRARSRRTTVVVIGAASVLAVAAVVGTVVVNGSGYDAPAAAADTKDWSEVAPTAGATEAPAPLPDGDTRALGQEVATTVGLDETATFPGSNQARIVSVTPPSTDGGRVGELSGDAVDVRLELVNVTDAAVAVDSVAVNVYYGADRTPATPADSDHRDPRLARARRLRDRRLRVQRARRVGRRDQRGRGARRRVAGGRVPVAATLRVSELDTDAMASPLISAIAHSGLTVADLDDALALWCSGLGFVLERTFTLDVEVTAATTGVHGAVIRAATVTLGPHRVELLQYDPPRLLESAGSPAQVGVVHIALTVSDLDRVLELCAAHGWRPVGTPHRMARSPPSRHAHHLPRRSPRWIPRADRAPTAPVVRVGHRIPSGSRCLDHRSPPGHPLAHASEQRVPIRAGPAAPLVVRPAHHPAACAFRAARAARPVCSASAR